MTTFLKGVLPGSRVGDFAVETDKGFHRLERKYTVRFLVVSNDPATDDELTVARTPGLPRIAQPWYGRSNSDVGSVAKRMRVTDVSECRTKWIVTVDFDSAISQEDPTTWEWGADREELAPYKDADGKEILNGAGLPYTNPPVTVSIPIPWVRISRIRVGFNPNQLLLIGATNSRPFLTAAVDTARLDDVSATQEDVNGVRVVRATYVVKFKFIEGGWLHYQPNVSEAHKQDPPAGKTHAFFRKTHNIEQGHVNADGLPLADIPTIPNGGIQVYRLGGQVDLNDVVFGG